MAVDRDFNPHAPCGARRFVCPCRACHADFNPRARVGRDRFLPSISRTSIAHFNPRARVGRDGGTGSAWLQSRYFNPRARVGRDISSCRRTSRTAHFNPRAPRGARLHKIQACKPISTFQSARPSWGATTHVARLAGDARISIHGPRVGRDHAPPRRIKTSRHFNPRAPRGARHNTCFCSFNLCKFQSTRPAWGATPFTRSALYAFVFQSTRPAWGATYFGNYIIKFPVISIHAPRVGRDRGHAGRDRPCPHFNPRAPRGARHALDISVRCVYRFQSTRPAWGATKRGCRAS